MFFFFLFLRDQRGAGGCRSSLSLSLFSREEEEEDEDEEDEEDERRENFFLSGNNKLLDLNFFLSFFLYGSNSLAIFLFSRERKEKERVFFLPSSRRFNATCTVSRNSRCLRLTSRFRSRPARRSPTPTLRSDRTRLNR